MALSSYLEVLAVHEVQENALDLVVDVDKDPATATAAVLPAKVTSSDGVKKGPSTSARHEQDYKEMQ